MGKMLDLLRANEVYSGWSPLSPVNTNKANPYEMERLDLLKKEKDYELQIKALMQEVERLRSMTVPQIKPEGDIRNLTPEQIEKAVCDFFGIKIKDLSRRWGRTRKFGTMNKIKFAKHLVRFCIVHGTQISIRNTGKRYDFDASTITNSIRYVNKWYKHGGDLTRLGKMPESVIKLINNLCQKTIFELK